MHGEIRAYRSDAPPDATRLEQELLQAGWRPVERPFNWEFFAQTCQRDFWGVCQRSLGIANTLICGLGDTRLEWWAKPFQLCSPEIMRQGECFWQYITPSSSLGSQRYAQNLSVEVPLMRLQYAHEAQSIDYLFLLLRERIIFTALDYLGTPDQIVLRAFDRTYSYPVERFQDWDALEVQQVVHAYWSEADIWLRIESCGTLRQEYTLLAKDLQALITKSTFDLALILSGFQSRIGQLQSEFPIASFPPAAQQLADSVQEKVMADDRFAVLVYGETGTGKTNWTQAVAKEILVPLGYVIFILDHAAFENFSPPSFLEKVCVIVNEADNLAKDRKFAVSQTENKTERILGLMDGTLYRSVIDPNSNPAKQKLAIFFTCNTPERLDPAFLRPGRVDIICKFTHKFVEETHAVLS
jgi:hypothetical protein